jgi:hypothetical protein
VTSDAGAWPALDYAADLPTIETCHLVLQLIGKLPTRLHPWINHGWHVALRVVPHGYATRMMPGPGGRNFTVELDVRAACIRVTCDTGQACSTEVEGKTIAQLHSDLGALLRAAGLPAPLHGAPNEIPDPVPFAYDERPRAWDRDAACRLHGAFASADRVFARFRSLYLGKSSPSHLFWGSFDLAVTRFSGREAPTHPGSIPNLPDPVTREAYSHEVISAGFWPGGGGVDEAAFYAYAYPTPPGLSDAQVAPSQARWLAQLGEFVLPYAVVAQAPDPEATLTAFLQSTYDAAARLLEWPQGLALTQASYGKPARRS